MARKSSNQAPEFVPSSDDKSENFDYLAQSSDIYPEPEIEPIPDNGTLTDEQKDALPVAEFLHDGTKNPYYHPGYTSIENARLHLDRHEYDDGEPVPQHLINSRFYTTKDGLVVEEPDDDSDVIILTPDWSYFRSLLAACSRFDGQTYEPGQWGNRKFTLMDVWCICYRVDFPATDKDIETQVKTLVKKGILVKEETGRWSANPILQMKSDALGIAEKKHTKHELKF